MQEWIVVCASVVNAATVVVLAWVTHRYARSAHRQADAAELQAKAAEEQARAASAQASAAQRSIQFSLEQFEEARSTSRSVVDAAMQRAVKEIEYWQKVSPMEVIGYRLRVQLVPVNQTEILQHARRVSAKGAEHLSEVFDCLMYAEREIEILQHCNAANSNEGRKHCETANEYLKGAFVKLQAAQLAFQTARR